MTINIKNFLLSQSKKSKIGDFQDLDHIEGVAISAISANLYKDTRDDLVLFILEMLQIMLQFIHSQKLFLKILNGI